MIPSLGISVATMSRADRRKRRYPGMKTNLPIYPFFIALSLLALSACSGSDDSASSAPVNTPHANETPAPTAPDLVAAQKWGQLKIQANSATTRLDYTGHYRTDRNGCGQDANGALDLDTWNPIATTINSAVAATMTTGDDNYFCPTPPTQNDRLGWPGFNRDNHVVDIQLESNTTQPLFETYQGQICTHIADHDLAQRLYDALNQLTIVADKTDCQNAPGYSN
jgi:hypothetical protein